MARGASLTLGEADELDRLTGKHTINPYSLASRERARLHRFDDRFRRSPENTPAAKVEKAELDRKLIAGESLTRRDQVILQQGLIIGPQSIVDRARAARPRCICRTGGSPPWRHVPASVDHVHGRHRPLAARLTTTTPRPGEPGDLISA